MAYYNCKSVRVLPSGRGPVCLSDQHRKQAPGKPHPSFRVSFRLLIVPCPLSLSVISFSLPKAPSSTFLLQGQDDMSIDVTSPVDLPWIPPVCGFNAHPLDSSFRTDVLNPCCSCAVISCLPEITLSTERSHAVPSGVACSQCLGLVGRAKSQPLVPTLQGHCNLLIPCGFG